MFWCRPNTAGEKRWKMLAERRQRMDPVPIKIVLMIATKTISTCMLRKCLALRRCSAPERCYITSMRVPSPEERLLQRCCWLAALHNTQHEPPPVFDSHNCQ